ncbi:antibiotic biosynthesis monooxygenase family protein [Ferribacterium limneticum]|jgi:heme-degrading monooxygenase HmoA|uniref:antibiotic biosynthesis monooxygenase family protein n=1 Tax=Ferribacterium limneticum TaxID=76259 RepID=UPI001CF80FFE|nr:antibiotic biosynthesis monooxygenase [Ferribacterium limneticum]
MNPFRKEAGMVVVVFRTRLKDGTDEQALTALGGRMFEIASAMPGFISYKDFAAPDGESVAIVEFDSLETLAAWRQHPEHLAAQEQGRQEYFASYQVQVCAPLRSYRFDASGRHVED